MWRSVRYKRDWNGFFFPAVTWYSAAPCFEFCSHQARRNCNCCICNVSFQVTVYSLIQMPYLSENHTWRLSKVTVWRMGWSVSFRLILSLKKLFDFFPCMVRFWHIALSCWKQWNLQQYCWLCPNFFDSNITGCTTLHFLWMEVLHEPYDDLWQPKTLSWCMLLNEALL
jgi:hypothetical protein